MLIEWKETRTATRLGLAIKNVEGFMGEWRVFVIDFDFEGIKPPTQAYELNARIPNILRDQGHFETLDQAKKRAESIMLKWIQKVGLRPPSAEVDETVLRLN